MTENDLKVMSDLRGQDQDQDYWTSIEVKVMSDLGSKND